MADNRLWVVSRVTGARALLGKAYAGGWYVPPRGLALLDELEKVFGGAGAPSAIGEDGFVLVAEGDGGPELRNVWVRADRVEALRAAGELVEPDTLAGLAGLAV